MNRLLQRAGSLEDLLRPRTHAIILGQIAPLHGAGAVEEKFGGAGDVGASDTGSFMEQVVLANDGGVRIGEDRERVARFARELFRDFRRIDADRDRTDAESLEVGETVLNTP